MNSSHWILGALVLGLTTFACGGGDEKEAVEIESVTSCKGSDCAKDDKATETDEQASKGGSADAPKTDGGTTMKPVPSENTCQTATDLGQLKGELQMIEANQETLSAQGTCSAWVKVRVNETSSLDGPMFVRATLISPATKKFGIEAFVNDKEDVLECDAPSESSNSTVSNVDKIDVTWGDDWLDDDSRWLTFHIKANGPCDPAGSWSLLLANGR